MRQIFLVTSFFEWYLYEIPREIIGAIKNFLKFGFHYFSIFFLLKTFFFHWHKYAWEYPRGFEPTKILETWFSNQISRILGMIVRSFLILIGIVYEIIVLIIGVISVLFWFILPFILLIGLIYGFKLLLSV